MDRAVIVIGMHRSGTSLVGNVLKTVGVNLGDELIEADLNNQVGYFENPAIVHANEELLWTIDRRWTGPKGTLDYPIDSWNSEAVLSIRKRLISTISNELRDESDLWGFKDPRVSRMIPFWKGIFDELNIRPIFILAVRHPTEVAKSVIKRDRLSSQYAQLLWLKHYQDALSDTKGDKLHIVIYDRWFNDLENQIYQLLSTLELKNPSGKRQMIADVKTLLRPDLRHHRPGGESCLPYVLDLYELLVHSAISGRIAPQIWDILEEVDRAERLFHVWGDFIGESCIDDKILERSNRKRKRFLIDKIKDLIPQ